MKGTIAGGRKRILMAGMKERPHRQINSGLHPPKELLLIRKIERKKKWGEGEVIKGKCNRNSRSFTAIGNQGKRWKKSRAQ